MNIFASLSENLPDRVPCTHPGCLHHLSHPCEGCGRIAGRRVNKSPIVCLKIGDFVNIESSTYWVCKCRNAPLNLVIDDECVWCHMMRPKQLRKETRDVSDKADT